MSKQDLSTDAECASEVDSKSENSSSCDTEKVWTDGEPVGDAKWYVIQTYSGYEDKVAKEISDFAKSRKLDCYFLEILVPKKEVETIKDGKKHVILEKLYPSYVLVRMHDNKRAFALISSRKGKNGCVGLLGDPPISLPTSEVEKFRRKKSPELVLPYKIGDSAQIIEGPFEDNSGIIKSIDLKKQEVTVVLSIFGRETPITTSIECVKKID